MKQAIGQVALVVREYDEALDFYVGTLGFTLVEDTYIPEQDKRWTVAVFQDLYGNLWDLLQLKR